MRRVRTSETPVALPPPAARRWWGPAAGAGAVVVMALALGGWWVARERGRAADRAAALDAAAGQRADAGERLAAYLARDPDDVEVLETLVVWSLKRGVPFAEVEPHLDRLCGLKPADPAPWRTRAAQRMRNGRLADGVADGLRALDLDPADRDTRKLVAEAALEAGDHAVAAREAARLLESPPPSDEVAAMLVRAHLQAGDAGRAEQALDRFFPAARTDAEARYLRGLVYQAAGRHAAAIPLFRAAADQSPEHRTRALFALAKSLSAAGRAGDARKVHDELAAAQARQRAILDAGQQPDDLSVQVRAAEAYLADGKPKEAAELLAPAVSKLGRTPAAAAVLARAYRQLGRDDLARRWEQAGP